MKTKNILIKSSLLEKVFVTFFYFCLIRAGMIIPLPGIDNLSLSKYIQNNPIFNNFLNIFSGGTFSTLGFLSLNIFPSINASILLEFLISIFPNLEKLRKEDGEEGEKKLFLIKKLLILLLSILQSIAIISFLRPFVIEYTAFYIYTLSLTLVTGSMIMFWISESITQKGLTNGTSLIIFTNILGNTKNLSLISLFFNSNSFYENIFLIFFFLILIFLIILVQESSREISIISAQQLTGENFTYFSKQNLTIPLKLNQSGILPIIFASSIFMLSSYFDTKEPNEFLNKIFYIFYYSLIIFFNYLYSTFAWDPKRISEDLKKVSSSIPGIRPGIQTEKYLNNILLRVSLIGGVILTSIVFFPSLLPFILKKKIQTLNITSLIILISVCLEIQKNIQTLVISNLIKENKNESTSIR
jgi:preprotein translocase subunit SecY